ncbi:MAG: Gfo/Idh/MocA family oxidoreductase [Spirochaetota bacterium]
MNIAIVGYGGLGKLHARNLPSIHDARLVSVCDIAYVPQADDAYAHFEGGKGGAPKDFNVYADARDMYAKENIDIVINALPSDLHASFNIQALEHGCHVFTEKPFALNVEDCDDVLRAAKKADRTLMVGQCMRFWPGWQEIKTYADDKRFGDLRYLSLRRIGGSPREGSWFFDPKRSGGVTMDLHIHDVDFANFIFGFPTRISASGIRDEANMLDIVTASYEYKEARVLIESGWMGKRDFVMEFQAVFDKTVMKYQGGKLMRYSGNTYEDVPIAAGGGHRAELEYFFECVRSGKAPELCMPGSSRDSISLALMSAESIAAGKTVTVQ